MVAAAAGPSRAGVRVYLQLFWIVMGDVAVHGGGDPGRVCCAFLHGMAAMVRACLLHVV